MDKTRYDHTEVIRSDMDGEPNPDGAYATIISYGKIGGRTTGMTYRLDELSELGDQIRHVLERVH